MIKQLFFTAALLVPSLAYAGNPSADLSVQIVPPPPPPPPNPVVPPQAAAAGFTTPVVQADFTVPGNFWSNTANYIVNCGASASVAHQPRTWHFYHVPTHSTSLLPCGQTTIGTDSLTGTQALIKTATAGQASNDTSIEFPTPYNSGQGWMPAEYYVKVKWRTDCLTEFQSAACTFHLGGTNGEIGLWTSSPNNGSGNHVDLDDFEPGWGSGYTWCQHLDFNSTTGSTKTFDCSTPNMTTGYHTTEALYTSDESTTIAYCLWVDGTFVGCNSQSLTAAAGLTDKGRNYFMSTATIPPNSATQNMTLWIASYEMWSCANIAVNGPATCPGTVVDHWPFP